MNLHKSRKSYINSQLIYKVLKIFSYVCAGSALAALVFILLFVFMRGLPHISLNFLFGEYKTTAPTIGPSLVGTLLLVLISVLIAAPIGVASAIFLTEYTRKGKLVRIIRLAAETLAAIPSVVYGLFGFAFFAVALKWGYSLLGGAITVSLMILPTIMRTSEEALLAVPLMYREASYALGASKVRTIFKVVLPNASGGIITSVILAIGRVISESAVFLFTIGMLFDRMPTGLMDWGGNLALFLYYHSSDALQSSKDAAAACGVVLIILVLIVNLAATLIGRHLGRGNRIKSEKKSAITSKRKEGVHGEK